MKKLVQFFVKIIKKTPVYPHWLENINRDKGDKEVISHLHGQVLETGAPTNKYRNLIKKTNQRKITKYLTSDHVTWKTHRSSTNPIILLLKESSQSFITDISCDATALPFKDSLFDSYCAFEVLEHVTKPKAFLLESKRVLKKGGICVLSTPFVYREHPSEDLDFFRYTRGGLRNLAVDSGFHVDKLVTFSYAGTAAASLVNQFVVRRILESGITSKIIFLLTCPFLFTFSNLIGFTLDQIYRDERFAARYHVVFQKV